MSFSVFSQTYILYYNFPFSAAVKNQHVLSSQLDIPHWLVNSLKLFWCKHGEQVVKLSKFIIHAIICFCAIPGSYHNKSQVTRKEQTKLQLDC
jgi:hypothetical protein